MSLAIESMKKVFYLFLVQPNYQFYSVLFVDGLKSHFILQLCNLCEKIKITLGALYPKADNEQLAKEKFALIL